MRPSLGATSAAIGEEERALRRSSSSRLCRFITSSPQLLSDQCNCLNSASALILEAMSEDDDLVRSGIHDRDKIPTGGFNTEKVSDESGDELDRAQHISSDTASIEPPGQELPVSFFYLASYRHLNPTNIG
ncbi:hypothetical protein V5799_014948 [Amblyomma americanum]|uniref:Uncharacterized protein n=1 Tax=Amblyomma americanum TaxID=6943 RepID=A0AAQ4E1J6_AMBAM